MLLPAGAAAAPKSGSTAAPLDFSNPAAEQSITLTASSLLALITDPEAEGAVSPLEADYLDNKLHDRPFRYTAFIPHTRISAAFEHNTLTVKALPHTYEAANGERVTWTPVDFLLTGAEAEADEPATYPLAINAAGDAYEAVVPDIPESTGVSLVVNYTCDITLPAAEADLYRNYTYDKATALRAEQDAYDALLADYNAYLTYLEEKAAYDAAYKKWAAYVTEKSKYEEKLDKYNAYVDALAIYKEQKAAYDAYVSALAAYNEQEKAYQAAYAAYQAELAAYNEASRKYEDYLAEVAKIDDVMTFIDNCFVSADGKQMYATLMGDTVKTVVSRKDELVGIGGVPPSMIDQADLATKNLQNLLTPYQALAGDRPAQLAYYQANYEAIKNNFNDLFEALGTLFENDNVVFILKNKDRFYRYIEFLCQLNVISHGLDDTKNRNPDWRVTGGLAETPVGHRLELCYVYTTKPTDNKNCHISMLTEPHRPDDKNNANPAGLTYPAAVPSPGEVPVLTAEMPTKPAKVTEPVEPDVVIKPTMPEKVDKPTMPAEVADPGEKPVAPAHDTTEEALVAAHRDGTLTKRPAGADYTLTFTSNATVRLSLQNKRVVEFYDHDGTLIFSTELDDGAPIIPPASPTRAEDAQYTYEFTGWKDAEGILLTDGSVVDDRYEVFYASYASTLRSYTVTWVIEGAHTTVTLPYGEKPQFSGETPEKAEIPEFTYTFRGWQAEGAEGWSNDLPPVIGDATYTAVFDRTKRSYSVTWLWGENTQIDTLDYGLLPTPPADTEIPEDDSHLYRFAGWDSDISLVTGSVTYTAQYDAVPIVSGTEDGKAVPPVLKDDTYHLTLPASGGLTITELLGLCLKYDRGVSLSAGNGTLTLSLGEAAITDLSSVGCTEIRVLPTGTSAGPLPGRYEVKFYGAPTDGQPTELTLSYPITLSYNSMTPYTVATFHDAEGHVTVLPLSPADDGKIATCKLYACGEIHFTEEFPIVAEPPAHGMITADVTKATAGTTVFFSFSYPEEYRPISLRVVGTLSGDEYPIESDSGKYFFIMPAEPVTVSGELALRTFTVTFVVDGEILTTQTYHMGDTVVLPPNPTKAPSGNTVYTFTGWSPAVVSVREDVTYTATFSEAEQGGDSIEIPDGVKNREYILYLEIAAVLLVVAAIPTTIILLVKRKKRKSAQHTDP